MNNFKPLNYNKKRISAPNYILHTKLQLIIKKLHKTSKFTKRSLYS